MRRRLREGKEEKFVPPPACPLARPRGMAVGGRREREEVRREIFFEEERKGRDSERGPKLVSF